MTLPCYHTSHSAAAVEATQLAPALPALPVEELDEVVAGGAPHPQHASRPADRRHGAAVLHLKGATTG